MTTNVYPAKATLFDRLAEESEPGRPLEGIQTAYEWPGQYAEMKCMYGGGVRFTQTNAVAERGVLVSETALVSVYIRVVSRPAIEVVDNDAICDEIAHQLGLCLRKNPQLSPSLTWAAIQEGAGDYSRTDQETISILSLQIAIDSMFGYE